MTDNDQWNDRNELLVVLASAETLAYDGSQFRNLKFWGALADEILKSEWLANKLANAWQDGRESVGRDLMQRVGPDGQRPYSVNPFKKDAP